MIPKPYLLFVGDAPLSYATKTAQGVREWAPHDCAGQWRLSDGAADLGLPDLDPVAARAAGARSLLIGIAPAAGVLPGAWVPSLVQALDAGLDLVSGLHQRLADVPELVEAAARSGRTLHDVRHADRTYPVATGRRRTGRRLLTVGTDCALGKKYTALAIARALAARGVAADFRATGQTGIMISGDGLAIDAVVADFIAGAAETLSPDAAPDHWDVIEGQGAIFHPAYGAVTLGLLYGSQPDVLILCHDPTRSSLAGWPDRPLSPLGETVGAYLTLARAVNPAARFAAVALNTSALSDAEARDAMDRVERELALPAFDPLRLGMDRAIEEILR